jgi:hypothetical protein
VVLCGLDTLVFAWVGTSLNPFSYANANRLTTATGHTELVVPAEEHPGGSLSTDGRYMLTGRTIGGQRERVVWDLATDQRYPYTLPSDDTCWVSPTQFAAFQLANQYYLVDAVGAIVHPVTLVQPYQTYGAQAGERIRERLRQADAVYFIEIFGYSGGVVLAIEDGAVFAYNGTDPPPGTTLHPVDLIEGVPHIRIPEPCTNPPFTRQLFSPDGRYYVAGIEHPGDSVRVYTKDGQLVAEARKAGWTPMLLGWRYDSSGVYFTMLIRGGAAASAMPAQPIFLLGPPRPADGQGRIIVTVGVLLLAACGAAAWWYWRRRAGRA